MENNKTPENPPAFPLAWDKNQQGQGGMDLRDYFATKALSVCYVGVSHETQSAKLAYRMADAMLIERQKNIDAINEKRMKDLEYIINP